MFRRIRSRSLLGLSLSAFIAATLQAASPGGALGTGDTAVLAAANAQLNAAVARDASGDFVVAWQTDVANNGLDYDIYFQRYNAFGVAQGSAVRVNTTTAGRQQDPAIAIDAVGNFVITWDSDQAESPAASGTKGIWMQRYDAAGVAQGTETQVNTYTTSDQQLPAVAMSASGAFVIAWQSLSQDGSGQGIYAQRFDSAGAVAGSEFGVNTFATSSQSAAAVAMNAAGAFVIAWQSNNQEGSGLVNGIYAQRYTAGGATSGGELHINTTTAGEQKNPSVGMSTGGSYAVAWESPDAGGTGIVARVIDASDSPLTDEIAVNTTTAGEQTAPALAMDADGDFTVAWTGTDASGLGLSFQRYNATGAAQGAETAANGTTTNSQQRPAIAADADGDFVIAWDSDQVSANGADIYARRFAGPENVDLSITKTDSPDPATTNAPVTYTILVTNNHATASTTGVTAVDTAIGNADSIVVTDTLPVNATAASGTNWTCTGVGTASVSCSYNLPLASGATTSPLTITITTPLTAGEISNTATVAASQSDTNTANNTATQKTYACSLSATPGSVQFSSATFSAAENAGTATITATRSGGTCGIVSVNYATSDGTATAGTDYTATSGTLTWANNDNANKTFTIPVINDAIDEPNKTVNIALSGADRATAGSPSSATLTINDDDAVTVAFTAATQSPDEGAGTVTVTATRTGATTFTVTIPYTVSGTATGGGTDHNAANGSITIAPGVSTGSTTFNVNDDALDESNETVIFTMGTPQGGDATTASPSTQTVTIVDNDATPTVNFNPASRTLPENDTGFTGVTVTAELSAVSGRTVTVPFTVSGTATDVGDHTASSGNITIAAGSTTGTYTFNVNGDARYENDETVVLTMGAVVNATAGTANVHTTTITNDDNPPSVTLAINNPTIAEAAGTATVTATLSGVSGLPVTVNLAYTGTATTTSDYTRSTAAITIPAGSTTGTAVITAVQDTVDEANETVIVDIDSVDNGTEMMVQQVQTAITDDDAAPTATLTLGGSPFAEAAGVATVNATLSAASQQDVTITLSLSGTATSGTDYAASGTTLTIPAGATTAPTAVTLTATQDSLDEANETVIVDLASCTNCTESGTQQVTATLTDDDAVTVSFAAATQSVPETGTVTVTATRAGASTFPITVPFTLSGTATGGGTDHDAVAGNITIPATANATESATYTFTVTADTRDEANETVIFTMGTPSGGTVTAAAPTTHTVTILDDDSVTVAFTQASQSIAEAGGAVTITATRSATTDFAVSVPFTVSGTAANPADHNAASGTITIPAGSTTGSYTFNVAQDTTDEGNETVVFTMGTPTGGDVSTTSPSIETVSITDDDAAPTIQFTAASQSAAEDVAGGTVTATLQLSAASGQDISVNFAPTGTAANGDDYTLSPASPGPVQILAGQTSAVVTFTVINDPTDEPNETAVLTLNTPVNVTIGTTSSHTLTIVDNDDIPQVSFTTSAQSVPENAGTAQVTVQLSRPSSDDVNVPFTVTGTAGGADYTITPSPITVVAGQTSAVINVAISNDGIDESDETVIVTMGTPANATPTGTTMHTLTIADDDNAPTASLSLAGSPFAENGGVATVTATLSSASASAVTINLTFGGTAAGSDYAASASSITIPAGSTTGSITLTGTNDSTDEPNETVSVSLGTLVNATAGATTSVTATLADDDAAPTVSFGTAQSITEGTGAGTTSVTVTATLSAASAFDVTVPFTVGGTATGGGVDHNAAAGSISIPAGSTSGTSTFTVARDAVDEVDETVVLTMGTPTNASAGTSSITITILDDDAAPTVSFSSASQSVAESGAATVTATLSAVSSKAISVPFTVSGTAGSADSNAASGTISIAAGAASGTYTFNVTADTLDETNETVVFTMGTPTNATGAAPTTHTVTITDDDATPTAAFSAASQLITEGDGGGATLVTVTVNLSAASGLPVTVPFTVGGTATGGGTDHNAVSGNIVIAAGATSGTYSFGVTQDSASEPDETVVLTMGTPVNATAGTPSAQTITIADDDAAAPPAGGGGGGGSFDFMSLLLLIPAWMRRRRSPGS